MRIHAPPGVPDAFRQRGNQSQAVEAADPAIGGRLCRLIDEAPLLIKAIQEPIMEKREDLLSLARRDVPIQDLAP